MKCSVAMWSVENMQRQTTTQRHRGVGRHSRCAAVRRLIVVIY